MRRRTSTEPAALPGQKWRATHQATIDAILGSGVRKVISRGSQFYNVDNWVARAFAVALCKWADLNPGRTPDRYDVEGWVVEANRVKVYDNKKGINIAATPDDLPKWLAFALVGGGYHEAWHTKYSRTAPLRVEEVWPKVLAYWSLLPGGLTWKGLTGALLEWSNIIEDIRIERVGCKEHPGSGEKLESLQDLILKMEREGRQAAEHRGLPVNDDLSAVMGTFRDLGLGYDTPDQGLAIESYEARSPKGYLFVTEGPMRSILDRSIALGSRDDLESLWLAMEAVAVIVKESVKPPPPQEPEEDEEEDEAKGEGAGEGAEGDPEDSEEEDGESESGQSGEGESGDSEGQSGEGSGESEEGEPSSGSGGSNGEPQKGAKAWKVGDRALLTAEGPHKGRTVEVTRAGLPNEEGVQDLEFALVEE